MRTDDHVAREFAGRYNAARATLLREMESAGLHAARGWRVMETTRQVANGMEIVLRPIHPTMPVPDHLRDLECVVRIDEDTSSVASNC